ncbi:MAG: hypothetical protein ACXWLH_01460 [Candidatus Saccharimonadales bacterium]
MFLSQRKHILRVLASICFVLALLLPVKLAGADPYGSGTYGSCNYNQTNCTSGGTGSGSGGSTAPAAGTQTILNNYPEYFTDSGKTFDLAKSKVIYFVLPYKGKTKKYSITVKEVGSNYAVLGISTIVDPIRLDIGQTVKLDLNLDGIDDISITYNGTYNKKANITFKALSPAPNTAVSAPTPVTATETKVHTNWWPLIISALAVLFGLSWFFWLIARRRKRKDNDDIDKLVQ